MEDFVPQKHEANEYNNGVQYVGYDASTGTNGDIVQAQTINNLVESALYAQQQAESANALVNSVVTDAYAPPLVGMHHIQFSGEPTPATIWAGTSWEIDTDYQGRTIIGSGGSYTFGDTGGSANAVLVNHTHILRDYNDELVWSGSGSGGAKRPTIISSDASYGGTKISYAGEDGTGKNMSPYKVVNYWKRIA